MSAIAPIDADRADVLLRALGEQLALLGERRTLAVVGGASLLVLGLVTRTTRDVDVVALVEGDQLVSAQPLPAVGPASMLDLGLPDGFLERALRRSYGDALTVLFASRLDQIHFKLYAVVDQGPGRHLSDLQALQPSEAELLQAARWSRTHDPSEGYRGVLAEVLEHLGVSDGLDGV
jgi:hypothetical protein